MFHTQSIVCGIIGNPIGHSLSPLLHSILSEGMGVDMVYVPLYVRENLKLAIEGAYALGLEGMNITIPYKQEVIPYLVEVEKNAQRIGAVNTLKRTQDGYIGYNTDIWGLKKALEKSGISLKNRHIIILGAGGAAKSVYMLAILEEAASITIINRSKKNIKRLIQDIPFSKNMQLQGYTLEELDILGLPYDNYIAFQSTSIGMYPNNADCIINEREFYKKCEVGIDLIYRPAQTKFMKYFKEEGKLSINGLDMLLYQGVLSWEIWNMGYQVKESVIEEARKQLKKALKSDD